MENLYFLWADGSAKLSGRDYEFQEPTLRRDSTVRRESHGDKEEFQPKKFKDDAEARKDFWSIQGDFIDRHHIEPRVQFHVPREESLPFPLKYIDVIRSTHTDLDVAQEKRMDDYLNVDGNRNLSDSWTGFTRFSFLNSNKIYVVRGETDKIQTTLRPDHIWPDGWIRIGKPREEERNKNGQSRNQNSNMPQKLKGHFSVMGNQETKTLICHQKNERNLFCYGQSRNQNSKMPQKLKGIYSVDPSDEEYKDIV